MKVSIVTDDGTKLLDTETASFPIAVNYSGIKAAKGKITFQYTITKVPEAGADGEAPEPVTTEKTIERTIEFTEER